MNKKTIAILESSRVLEGKKVLYFEGAGMDFEQNNLNQSDVLNHRIRTSFLTNEGEQIYLELGNTYMRDTKGKNTEKMGIWIDFLFKVPTEESEIKYHEIYKRHEEHLKYNNMDYTKENLTKIINERLNCDFDTIHVLDSMYRYYVHGDRIDGNNVYNLMENIELNHEKASKAREAYENYYEWYTKYRKFPCLSVIELTENFIKIKTHDSEKMLSENEIDREVVINF